MILEISKRFLKAVDIIYPEKIMTINKKAIALEKDIGINKATITKALSLKSKPSAEILGRFLTRFENISCEWLMTGRGEIIVNQESLTSQQKLKLSENEFDIASLSKLEKNYEALKQQMGKIMAVQKSHSEALLNIKKQIK